MQYGEGESKADEADEEDEDEAIRLKADEEMAKSRQGL